MPDLETPKLAIFDLGNVVFRIDWTPMFETWSAASGVEAEKLRSRFLFDENYDAFERGNITASEFHERLCSTLDAELSYAAFEAGWNAIYRDVVDGIDLTLEELKGKLRVVAFTNTNEVHCLVWPNRYRETLSHFEKIFISSQLGARKPEAEGFRRVLGECGVLPEEAVFFDDFEPNVRGAAELGIRAVLVDSPEVVREELRRLGLMGS